MERVMGIDPMAQNQEHCDPIADHLWAPALPQQSPFLSSLMVQ
jgi:hypothetical protein